MVERTDGRHKPGIPWALFDAVSQTEYLSSSSSPDIKPFDYSFLLFSSQESSSRSNFGDDYPHNGGVLRAKRARNSEACASTLLEAKEFGELMEHEDEVRFALQGLRKGQSLRIRRASLSSLLSICASQHQRRSLRAHAISESIINAILVLSLDDIPSNLAAATLFFVLTADGQDEHFMESPKCIKFLIKLLKPLNVTTAKEKPRNIGFRLLSLLKDVDDSSSSDILSRVQELLVNCKEMRMNDSCKIETTSPEQSTKWIALLAMERACLSKFSFDDASGSVKKTGGIFNEKLRELGGLDTVLEVVMDCHAVLERWVEYGTLSVQEKKDNLYKQSLMLLLKCLKIMENATFLSKNNQNHLLKFKKSLGSHESRISFIELTISVTKMLSGLHLRRGFPSPNRKNVNPHYSNGGNCDSILGADRKVANEVVTISSDIYSNVGSVSTRNKSVPQSSQSTIHLDFSSKSSVSGNEPITSKTRVGSTTSGSFTGRLASSGIGVARSTSRTSQAGEPSCKKNGYFASPEESKDPFDLEDSEPCKWVVVSLKQKKSRSQKKKGCYKQSIDESLDQLFWNQEESSNHRLDSQEELSSRNCSISLQPSSCTNGIDKECQCLLSDCLVTALKVLVTLTDENAVGCRQVGGCRGLESIAELIARHFPSFTRSPFFSEMEKTGSSRPKKASDLTDEELDFLVVILGLLINLVEKDRVNRSWLASASVPITKPEGLQESEQKMIPLLCSIFLTLDDEEADLEGEEEAENMIMAAYPALVLAYLSTESRSIRNSIKDYLPKRNLAILVPVMERFVAFNMNMNMITRETHKAMMEVIESCKLP